MRRSSRMLVLACAVALSAMGVGASGPATSVSTTVHNLSVSGPGQVKSLTETEVCKFCHIPHSAVVNEPLWGQALSAVADYKVPKLKRDGARVSAPQPDGASRLCLSCHDGTVAIGNMHGRGKGAAIGRMGASRRGYLGTDLSGSHPVSIVVPEFAGGTEGSDMALKPRSAIEAEGAVRLDESGRMQCTSCHDPHSDSHYREGSVPHFWVRPTVTEVCIACHELR